MNTKMDKEGEEKSTIVTVAHKNSPNELKSSRENSTEIAEANEEGSQGRSSKLHFLRRPRFGELLKRTSVDGNAKTKEKESTQPHTFGVQTLREGRKSRKSVQEVFENHAEDRHTPDPITRQRSQTIDTQQPTISTKTWYKEWGGKVMNAAYYLTHRGPKLSPKREVQNVPPSNSVLQHRKPLVFGIPLHNILESDRREFVPCLVENLANLIELHEGLEVEGIFRVAPRPKDILEIQNRIDDGQQVDLELVAKENVHVICSLLKKYLRELPEPIISTQIYSAVIAVAGVFRLEGEAAIQEATRIFKQLQQPNKGLLIFLINLFGKVAENQATTKMNEKNLAIVLAPLLIWKDAGSEIPNVDEAMTIVKVIEVLIKHRKVVLEEGS